MKLFFELGDRYASKSTWKDFALLKFCLCAMGILIGLAIPKKYKSQTAGVASGIFAVTYVVLMVKVFKVIKEMMEERGFAKEEDFEEE